jgi:hypothetical protein
VSAAYRKIETADAFSSACEQMQTMEEHLRSDAAFADEHTEIERYVREAGRELERRLVQAHLDLRAERERPVEVRGADGTRRGTRRILARQLLTVVGEVAVPRAAYQAPGVEGLCPADAALNLPEELYSFGVRRVVAEAASKESFDEVVATTAAIIGTAVPKRQVEELVIRAAQDFEAFYATREVVPSPPSALMVFGFDGKGVVMLHEHLREATKRAAEKAEHKLKTRLCRGEKANRKRMAEVATVYSVEPWVRTPADIMNKSKAENDVEQKRPRPVNKRVFASLEASPEAVIRAAFEEGSRRDPERQRRWVVVIDGNRDQLRLVKKVAKEMGVTVTIVLDLIHVVEYLWRAAYCFHAEGTAAAEQWVSQRLRALLDGRSAGALAKDVRRWIERRELSAEKAKNARACVRYLVNNSKLLHYDRALADGLPIASGVIEGACRHLVEDRLGITGARWGLPRAEAILKLRALRSSGDFEAYWDFHVGRERARNHECRYADRQVPAPLWPVKPRLRVVK